MKETIAKQQEEILKLQYEMSFIQGKFNDCEEGLKNSECLVQVERERVQTLTSKLLGQDGEISALKNEVYEGKSKLEGLQTENKKLQRITDEMQRVISGEQEKLNEAREQARQLKEKVLDQ